jgi:hypothetical protein
VATKKVKRPGALTVPGKRIKDQGSRKDIKTKYAIRYLAKGKQAAKDNMD